MTLVVSGDNDDAGIASGRLIINIPSGFAVAAIETPDTENDINGEFPAAGNAGALTLTPFSDGSTQLTGSFTNLGTVNGVEESLTVKLYLTAPIVTTNATYIVFGLAEGSTEAFFTSYCFLKGCT